MPPIFVDTIKYASIIGLLATAATPVVAGGKGVPAPIQAGKCTGPESDTRLYVNVSNVRSNDGLIAVTLYANDSKKFLAKHGSVYVGRVPAHAPETRACIHIPRPGTYAIAIYHDADSSTKFNRNGLGMPAEGYGFSNNPGTFFGLPSFKKVLISIPRDGTEISIKMKYP